MIDADTIVADVELPWKVKLSDRSIRFLGFNAWEIRGPERLKGLESRKAFIKLLDNNDGLYIREGYRFYDNFGRVLGWFYIEKDDELIDVRRWAKNNGHCKIEYNKPITVEFAYEES